MRTAVSALVSGLLVSVSLILAVDLALIMFFALFEIAVTLFRGGQWEISALFWVALVMACGGCGLAVKKPGDFGTATSAAVSLNILPLALLDAFILLTAVAIANQCHQTLATPVLQFTQTILNQFTE